MNRELIAFCCFYLQGLISLCRLVPRIYFIFWFSFMHMRECPLLLIGLFSDVKPTECSLLVLGPFNDVKPTECILLVLGPFNDIKLNECTLLVIGSFNDIKAAECTLLVIGPSMTSNQLSTLSFQFLMFLCVVPSTLLSYLCFNTNQMAFSL